MIRTEGNEVGGHSGQRATLTLVPAVSDAVAPIPVVAADGIADGRGLAASLLLGAQGALKGTRFYASKEALGSSAAKQRLVCASGDQTVRTRLLRGRADRACAWARLHVTAVLRSRIQRDDFCSKP